MITDGFLAEMNHGWMNVSTCLYLLSFHASARGDGFTSSRAPAEEQSSSRAPAEEQEKREGSSSSPSRSSNSACWCLHNVHTYCLPPPPPPPSPPEVEERGRRGFSLPCLQFTLLVSAPHAYYPPPPWSDCALR